MPSRLPPLIIRLHARVGVSSSSDTTSLRARLRPRQTAHFAPRIPLLSFGFSSRFASTLTISFNTAYSSPHVAASAASASTPRPFRPERWPRGAARQHFELIMSRHLCRIITSWSPRRASAAPHSPSSNFMAEYAHAISAVAHDAVEARGRAYGLFLEIYTAAASISRMSARALTQRAHCRRLWLLTGRRF
jgi:hypothetical protein